MGSSHSSSEYSSSLSRSSQNRAGRQNGCRRDVSAGWSETVGYVCGLAVSTLFCGWRPREKRRGRMVEIDMLSRRWVERARCRRDGRRSGGTDEIVFVSVGSKSWPSCLESSSGETAAGVGGMNFISGGCGGSRGLRSGESASISSGCERWGGVIGSGSVGRGREEVRRCIGRPLGAGRGSTGPCSTMSTDLFWCGYRFIASASDISSAVPCVSCDDCENGVT